MTFDSSSAGCYCPPLTQALICKSVARIPTSSPSACCPCPLMSFDRPPPLCPVCQFERPLSYHVAAGFARSCHPSRKPVVTWQRTTGGPPLQPGVPGVCLLRPVAPCAPATGGRGVHRLLRQTSRQSARDNGGNLCREQVPWRFGTGNAANEKSCNSHC